jgi:hypothetical protein
MKNHSVYSESEKVGRKPPVFNKLGIAALQQGGLKRCRIEAKALAAPPWAGHS